MKVYIPFNGFYGSILDDYIQSEVEFSVECEAEDTGKVYDWNLNYDIVNKKVASLWSDCFMSDIENRMKTTFKYHFNKLISPKEYNFSTDVIEVEIADDDMKDIHSYVMSNSLFYILKDLVREELKERSGFIPFHSVNILEWNQDVTTWTASQCELLFRTFMLDGFESVADYEMYFLDFFKNQIDDAIEDNFELIEIEGA